MSYSQAWQLLDLLESKLGFPLLSRTIGGSTGRFEDNPGGTKTGEKVYPFQEEARQLFAELFVKHFAGGGTRVNNLQLASALGVGERS